MAVFAYYLYKDGTKLMLPCSTKEITDLIIRPTEQKKIFKFLEEAGLKEIIVVHVFSFCLVSMLYNVLHFLVIFCIFCWE